MGTGNQPKLLLLTGCALISTIALVKGWHARCSLINMIAFGNYNKAFQPVRTHKDWLSKDTQKVDEHIADEYCSFSFSLNAYFNMFRGMLRLHNKKLLSNMPKELPVFFVAGEDDPVGDFGKGVLEVADLFRKLGMKKVKTKLYPKDRHEILNETDRNMVYNDLYSWLMSLI